VTFCVVFPNVKFGLRIKHATWLQFDRINVLSKTGAFKPDVSCESRNGKKNNSLFSDIFPKDPFRISDPDVRPRHFEIRNLHHHKPHTQFTFQ
jgi:hypothetical protein